MANKSFSIYGVEEEAVADADDRLILEVGKTHIACLIKKEHKRSVSAFELFNFNEDETADFTMLFKTVSSGSKILARHHNVAEVFINNELGLLVPIFKFDKEIAADYMDIVFGEDPFSQTRFEHLPIEPGVMNVYRVAEGVMNVLHANFEKLTIRHTWSNVVKNIISDIFVSPFDCIYIRFYITFFIVSVIKNEKLQIIQSFVYETPEDVLYHLLNITTHFELNNDNITLQISGMIDLNFTLYRDLITYFRNVDVQNVKASDTLLDLKEYPLHYFTPFFNLAK